MINLGRALIIIKGNDLASTCRVEARGGGIARVLNHLRNSGCLLFTSSVFPLRSPNTQKQHRAMDRALGWERAKREMCVLGLALQP